jgi:GH24 family phage-related lysozyme (muramidase)
MVSRKEIIGWLLVPCIGYAGYYLSPQATRAREVAYNQALPDPGEPEFYPESDPLIKMLMEEPQSIEEIEPQTTDEPVKPKTYVNHTDNIRAPVAKSGGDAWYIDGKPNYFRCVILETKRREALGRRGEELERYKDGDTWAIGYGCHIKYLSPYWKKTLKKQRYKITEIQARAIMYEVMHLLEQQVKRDLPNANRRQRLAVISLSYNWGYGNVKRSGLWKHIKAGSTGNKVAKAWMRTQSQTENHRKSRRMEVALWNGADKIVLQTGKSAYQTLKQRGDFEHY